MFFFFFLGSQYWTSRGFQMTGSPRSISDFGLPSRVRHVDAAVYLKDIKKTLLFVDTQFYRYVSFVLFSCMCCSWPRWELLASWTVSKSRSKQTKLNTISFTNYFEHLFPVSMKPNYRWMKAILKTLKKSSQESVVK